MRSDIGDEPQRVNGNANGHHNRLHNQQPPQPPTAATAAPTAAGQQQQQQQFVESIGIVGHRSLAGVDCNNDDDVDVDDMFDYVFTGNGLRRNGSSSGGGNKSIASAATTGDADDNLPSIADTAAAAEDRPKRKARKLQQVCDGNGKFIVTLYTLLR